MRDFNHASQEASCFGFSVVLLFLKQGALVKVDSIVRNHWSRLNARIQKAGRKSESGTEYRVSRDRYKHKANGHLNAKYAGVRREEHAKFKREREQDRPGPMPSRGVADHRQIHHAEGRAITEVVSPSDDLSDEGIFGLFNRLPEHHRSEAREDFEQVYWGHNGINAPFLRKHEWEAEEIVGHRC